MASLQISGEYELEGDRSLSARARVEDEVIDHLMARARSHRFVTNLRNARYWCTRHDGGGTIILTHDVDCTIRGRVLAALGIAL
jgi:hypothetical protein